MQGNGNEYGRPYDPRRQDQGMRYQTIDYQNAQRNAAQPGAYSYGQDAHAHFAQQMRQAQPQYQPAQPARPAAPQQQMPASRAPQQQMPAPRAPRAPQNADDLFDLDMHESVEVYETASHDAPFEEQRPGMKYAVIAGVMALVIACGGFVTSRIKAERAAEAAAQNPPSAVVPEQIIPSEEPVVIVEAAEILSLVLNTAAPAFGSARLQIDFEVDRDAVVRVEILKADGSVFCVVEEGMQLSEGKMRVYFDGKDAAGAWIPVGNYQVRVSSLATPQDETADVANTQNWTVDNSKTIDFVVNAEARPTQNSRPAAVSTPTPSPSP